MNIEMSEIGKELWDRVDAMFDDPDTTLGVYVNLKNDQNRLDALRYLNTAEKRGEEVTADQILILSIIMSKE